MGCGRCEVRGQATLSLVMEAQISTVAGPVGPVLCPAASWALDRCRWALGAHRAWRCADARCGGDRACRALGVGRRAQPVHASEVARWRHASRGRRAFPASLPRSLPMQPANANADCASGRIWTASTARMHPSVHPAPGTAFALSSSGPVTSDTSTAQKRCMRDNVVPACRHPMPKPARARARIRGRDLHERSGSRIRTGCCRACVPCAVPDVARSQQPALCQAWPKSPRAQDSPVGRRPGRRRGSRGSTAAFSDSGYSSTD